MKEYYIDLKNGIKIYFGAQLSSGESDGGVYAPTTRDGEILYDQAEPIPLGESIPEGNIQIPSGTSLAEKICSSIRKNYNNYNVECKLAYKININDLKLHVCLDPREEKNKRNHPKLNILITCYYSKLLDIKYDSDWILDKLNEKLKSFDPEGDASQEITLFFHTNKHVHWHYESCPVCQPKQ